MPRPIHFEIPADEPERIIGFYQTVFGWSIQKWEGGGMPYWLITTGPDGEPGINGGILKKRDPEQPCVNTVGVANLDEAMAAVTGSGGTICVPKMPIPGVGWLAYGKDPEGNIFGMMQADTNAK
jgi:predicted enzyme related to lactoylglutathione lyase